jgi:anti-sigma B factor antagonist
MAIPQGTVRFHYRDDTVTFRVEGRGTMTQSLPMRRCAERCMAGGARQVRVDLRDCTYMDSTFLGTLLTLKKALDRTQGKLTLVMPSVSCDRILQQMGLGDVLPAESADIDPSAAWLDVAACEADDPTSFRRNVTQAHEELARLPGPAGEQFKAVMRCLEDAPKKDKPAE